MDLIRQIRVALAPFVLRRLKSQVLSQMPPKTQREEQLPPMPTQKALYDGILRRHVERQRRLHAGKGGGGGGGGRGQATRPAAEGQRQGGQGQGDGRSPRRRRE